MIPSPTVSVVIPAYNASSTLAETLQSVLAQTAQPEEILIIDDQSQDDTRKIVEGYQRAHPQVRLIEHDRNQGVTATRNTGIAAAKGTWIAFLDADDLWVPDKLRKQLEYAAQHPDLDAIGCWYIELFAERHGAVREQLFWQSALLIRREAAADILFNPGWRTADLPEFWSRFDRKYTRGGLPEPLMLYRLNLSGLAHRTFLLERKAWLLVGENTRRRSRQQSEIAFQEIEHWYRQTFSPAQRLHETTLWRGDLLLREALIYAQQKRYLKALGKAFLGAMLNPVSIVTKVKRASTLFSRDSSEATPD